MYALNLDNYHNIEHAKYPLLFKAKSKILQHFRKRLSNAFI